MINERFYLRLKEITPKKLQCDIATCTSGYEATNSEGKELEELDGLEDVGVVRRMEMQTFISEYSYDSTKRQRELYDDIKDLCPSWANAYFHIGTYCRYLPGEINLPMEHVLYLRIGGSKEDGSKKKR